MNLFKVYIHIYAITWVLLIVHTVFVTSTFSPYNSYDLDKIIFLLVGLLNIIVQVQLAKLLSFGSRKLSFVFTILLLLVYAILYAFHFNQKVSLDFSLIYENFSLIFYKESIDSMIAMLSMSYLFYALFIVLVVYFFNKRYSLISYLPSKNELSKTTFFVVIILNIFFVFSPIKNSNNISEFIQSIIYFQKTRTLTVSSKDEKEFPYINVNNISGKFSSQKEKPHVFLLFMESYNGLFTDKLSRNGKEITPYFNKLKNNGLFLENFYGHSIQTAKGQFGTLSGIFPSVYSKVFTTYGNLNINALPNILNNYGYETVFTKAYRSLAFDNTRNYAKKLGFKHIESLGVKKYLTKEDEGKIWGWGLQDDQYYKKFFNYIDEIHEKGENKPFFGTLTTVSNHMMFDKIPNNQKYLYPKANKSKYENFVNSLHLADKYLETFFEELKKRDYLKNSIVIVTGDHSWPSGDHGYWHNETSFYNEFFEIPFLILWDNIIKAETVKNEIRSQIDIAPTILDMLNIRTKNHFIGESIFLEQKDKTVFLIQPYSGTYIVAQDDNFKYVKHIRGKEEFLFDLENDPKELNNLIINKEYYTKIENLRKKSKKLLDNDSFIRENKIWPADTSSTNKNIKKNFKFTVLQQDRKIDNIDTKFNTAYEMSYYIDTIDFKNASELIHKRLGKLNFFSDFFTLTKGDFIVNKTGYFDIKIESDDGFELKIDKKLIGKFKSDRPMKANVFRMHLTKGKHSIDLKHFQGYGFVGLKVSYKFANENKYSTFGNNNKYITFSE